MNETPPPLFTEPISDEATYVLADMLNQMSTAFENACYAQIHRHLKMMRENRITNDDQP